MATQVETDQEFWRGVLVAGGSTTIPRWTLHPMTGVDEHEATIPDDVLDDVRRLATDLAMPLGSVMLAAHAKVLAALAGEQDVTTGYVAEEGGRPLPCRLATAPESWRALLVDAHRGASELVSHKDFPVDALRRELGLSEAPIETVFDPHPASGPRPTDVGGGLFGDTVLWVGFSEHGGRAVLRLRYRTDVLDADHAARIAGYHLAALTFIAADPDAEHARQSLLSTEELRFQLEGLSGPRRALPDVRMHELFEQQARVRPDAVVAVHGDRQWTYEELNARANQLGRALLARGLQREGVVAVVTGRNLDWMAAVLAVFKAGGVYLPVEPHFPADRIAAMLSRAECGLVLTEPGSTDSLDQALDSLPGSGSSSSARRTTRAMAATTWASPSRRTNSPTSTSPPAPRESPRERCASTRACSTTSTPRSTTWESTRGRWSPRPPPSASTSRCGNWCPRSWSVGGPCWWSRR